MAKWPELDHVVHWRDYWNWFSSWGGKMFWSDPIKKAVLCCVLSIARTRAITCSIVCCEKSVNVRVIHKSSRNPARKVSVI